MILAKSLHKALFFVTLFCAVPRSWAADGVDDPARPALPPWIAGLSTRTAADREGAFADLPHHMLDPRELKVLLAAAQNDPEVEARAAAASMATPALAPLLAQVARGAPDGSAAEAAMARKWLVGLVATEIARRAPLERLTSRAVRVKLFSDGVVSGASWPLVGALSLQRAIAMLDRHAHLESRLVLDPTLRPLDLPPVEGLEFLPTTAGGLLKRLLESRGLRMVDVGLFSVVTSTQTEQAISDEREKQSETREGVRIELGSARFLVDLLVGPAPADPVTRFFVWRALAFQGAAEAAGRAEADAVHDLDLSMLAATARTASAAFVRKTIEVSCGASEAAVDALVQEIEVGGPDEAFAAVFDELRTSPVPRARAAALGLFLRASDRGSAIFLRSFLEDETPVVRRLVLTALLRGDGVEQGDFVDASTPKTMDSLARSLSDDVLARPSLAAWLHRERSPRPLCPTEARFRSTILSRSPTLAAFDFGLRFHSATPTELRQVSGDQGANFLLGAALGSIDGGCASPAVARLAVERLGADPALATVALSRCGRPQEYQVGADRIGSFDERTARALISFAGIEHASGRDELASAIYAALRQSKSQNRLGVALYKEIDAVLSASDCGDLDLVEEWELGTITSG